MEIVDNNLQHSILSQLREDEFEKLLLNGKKEFHKKNDIIINEGDKSDCAYFINSGRVDIFLSDDCDKKIVLCELTSGKYFGEMALIDKNERSASAIAMEDTTLTIITRSKFRELIQSNHEIYELIIECITFNLREANKKISGLVFKSAYERVARMLLDLARVDDGLLIINDKPTHQHIADVVGVSREMVTRIMGNMVTEGHIEIKGKSISIDRNGLLSNLP